MRTNTCLSITAAALLVAGCAPAAVMRDGGMSAGVAAIADSARPESDRIRDAERRPAELLALAEVRRDATIIEVWPGPGYWTRLFSSAVGPKGRVVAYVPRETIGFRYKPLELAKATAGEPGRGNIAVDDHSLAQPFDAGGADLVWTAQNYHDLHNIAGVDLRAFNRSVFAALKPGGVYVVIDHAAPTGSRTSHTKDLHRIDPATVRAEVEGAGFVLETQSPVLAHPDDPRTANVFDPVIRGRTDQFVYKFRKTARQR